ncbi:hypothetical protein M5689_018066 [Euphorbia peplus]|nr:hypothetical protein M5689_018066 [Euphorbia peplus]
MIPTIVARKIASSCHAGFVTPAGTGTNQRMTPVAIEASNGFIAAPCHGCGGVAAGAEDTDDALTVKSEVRRLRIAPLTLDLERFGRNGVAEGNLPVTPGDFPVAESFGREGKRVDLRERDLSEGMELKAREQEVVDVRASDAIIGGAVRSEERNDGCDEHSDTSCFFSVVYKKHQKKN